MEKKNSSVICISSSRIAPDWAIKIEMDVPSKNAHRHVEYSIDYKKKLNVDVFTQRVCVCVMACNYARLLFLVMIGQSNLRLP